jgi:hypothetical protein
MCLSGICVSCVVLTGVGLRCHTYSAANGPWDVKHMEMDANLPAGYAIVLLLVDLPGCVFLRGTEYVTRFLP